MGQGISIVTLPIVLILLTGSIVPSAFAGTTTSTDSTTSTTTSSSTSLTTLTSTSATTTSTTESTTTISETATATLSSTGTSTSSSTGTITFSGTGTNTITDTSTKVVLVTDIIVEGTTETRTTTVCERNRGGNCVGGPGERTTSTLTNTDVVATTSTSTSLNTIRSTSTNTETGTFTLTGVDTATSTSTVPSTTSTSSSTTTKSGSATVTLSTTSTSTSSETFEFTFTSTTTNTATILIAEIDKRFSCADVDFDSVPADLGLGCLLTEVDAVVHTDSPDVPKSTNPGQIMEAFTGHGGPTDMFDSLKLWAAIPLNWKINPDNSGTIGVHILFQEMSSSGVTDITQFATISHTPGTNTDVCVGTQGEVHVEVADITDAIGHKLGLGDKIHVFFKLQYALKHQPVTIGNYPCVDEDTAMVEFFNDDDFNDGGDPDVEVGTDATLTVNLKAVGPGK